MKNFERYGTYIKPKWAPPPWLFAPVWTVLYLIIVVSFGYVAYLFAIGNVPLSVALPFACNLVANFLYTPLQFRLRNFLLASVDIVVVWISLVVALVSIYPYASWVALGNVPYLAWVTFATVLQLTITFLNRRYM